MLKKAMTTPMLPGVYLSAPKILFILLVIAFSLRLVFLGSKSLWLDEANALHIAHIGQEALWAGNSELYHPPLFYWFLEIWERIGSSEFILRFPGVIFGTITIYGIYVLAKDLFGHPVALSAASIATFSPLLVWYAQDMRPYALLCLLGLMVIIASFKLFLTPRIHWWLLFVTSMASGLYLHYFAILLLPLQLGLLAVMLALRRAKGIAIIFMLLGWGAVTLIYWPWLQTPAATKFLKRVTSGNNDIFHVLADRLNIVIDMANFTNGFALGVGVLLGGGGLWGLYRLFRSERIRTSLLSLRTKKWIQVTLLVLFLGLLVASVIPRGYTIKRQLVILWPYAILAFAWFWPWQKSNYIWLLNLLIISLIGSLINILIIPKPQWREATAFIRNNHQTNDLVVLEPHYYTITYDFYEKSDMSRMGIPFNLPDSKLDGLLNSHDRVWLVVHGTDPHTQNQAKAWLDKKANLINVTDYFRLQVRLYHLPDK